MRLKLVIHPKSITPQLLSGQDIEVMVPFRCAHQDKPVSIHPLMVEPLLKLKKICAREGFDLAIASGFRSQEQQQRIWNSKAQGLRAVLNLQGEPMDIFKLSEVERVLAIMRWSALPGASRHHWGSEIDVYNRRVLEKVELTPQEVADDGPMGPFHLFLDEVLDDLDFFRPYEFDLGGVATERWHLSYAPLSEACDEAFDRAMFAKVLMAQDFELKEAVISMADQLFDQFIKKITPRSLSRL
jgi:LAS superfamily LD-carboxypeptidase LdcB